HYEINRLPLVVIRKRPTLTSFHPTPPGSSSLLQVSINSEEVQDIPARAIRVVMKCCGEPMLERALGLQRLRQLKRRYGEISAQFAAL
ncbi:MULTISPECIES: hypothetical protein, partial [unclassified Bradyrhizobium]|uniref:hypothetical protein n=1 Tax=unclassified Bradyrhizobium TaxID=2631580 RepID=UPI001CD220E0